MSKIFEKHIGKIVTVVVSEGNNADATTGELTNVNDNVLEITTREGKKHYFNVNTFLKIKIKEDNQNNTFRRDGDGNR